MKKLLLALIATLGFGLAATAPTLAAPIAGAPIAQAADSLPDAGIQHVWYDRYGRWHPNRAVVRPPVVVAPPVYVAPRPPVCRRVWVCSRPGVCTWRTRCY